MKKRQISLDFLRGFAILAILIVNIAILAQPEQTLFSLYNPDSWDERLSWLTIFALFDGKMRGILSILFGVGIYILYRKYADQSINPKGVHYARMFWLALLGFMNFIFIWFGDILFLYAVCGIFAYWGRRLSIEKMTQAAILLFSAGFITWNILWMPFYLTHIGAIATDPSSQNEMNDALLITGSVAKGQLDVYLGTYLDILRYRLTERIYDLALLVLLNFWEVIGFMWLGMIFYRMGLFSKTMPVEEVRSLFQKSLIAGLLLMAPIILILLLDGFSMPSLVTAFSAWSIPSRIAFTIAYITGFILLLHNVGMAYKSSPTGITKLYHRIIKAIALSGRVALTNYIFSHLILAGIFYGWGLGLFGSIDRPVYYLFLPPLFFLMLSWPYIWLHFYKQGPLEAVWRFLTKETSQM